MKIEKVDITHFELISLLDYDPDTGVFASRHHTIGKRKGEAVGSKCNREIRITILGKVYMAHRLAWLYMTGSFPDSEIDHIDGNPKNNKWSNLRLATSSQNSMNIGMRSDNTSGYKGVSWAKDKKKFLAYIYLNGARKYLGLFNSAETAGQVAAEARAEYFGEYDRLEK